MRKMWRESSPLTSHEVYHEVCDEQLDLSSTMPRPLLKEPVADSNEEDDNNELEESPIAWDSNDLCA